MCESDEYDTECWQQSPAKYELCLRPFTPLYIPLADLYTRRSIWNHYSGFYEASQSIKKVICLIDKECVVKLRPVAMVRALQLLNKTTDLPDHHT